MEEQKISATEEQLVTSSVDVKEEDEVESQKIKCEPTDDPVIKEELNIDDASTSSADFLGLRLEDDLGSVEATRGGEKSTSVDKPPFTLCLVDDDGNVLEEYVERNGRLSPVVLTPEPSADTKPEPSAGEKPKRLPRKKRPFKKNLLKEKNKKQLNCHRRDEILKYQNYSCDLCYNKFNGRRAFKAHISRHYSADNGSYRCCGCEYVATQKGHINRHIIRSHSVNEENGIHNERLFHCTLCDKTFFDRRDLERHMFVHTHIGPFKCSACNFSHVKKYELKNHMREHTGGEGERYECNDCGIIFKSKKTLSSHIGSIHLDIKEFECDICEYKCESKSVLARHMYRHLGEGRFQCDICGYSCVDKGDLNKHLTTHSDERPFSCNVCSKTFKRKSYLRSHFKRKKSCQ